MKRIWLSTGDRGFDSMFSSPAEDDGRVPAIAGMHNPKSLNLSMLIRGATGTGKTLLALQTAHSFAAQLEGDVIWVTLEQTPTELIAQAQSFWPEQKRPIILCPPYTVERPQREDGKFVPFVFASFLRFTFQAGIDHLIESVVRAEGAPKVLVVDAVSNAYRTGDPGPGEEPALRELADTLVKGATGGSKYDGMALIVIEEGTPERSPWLWPCDIVLELYLEEGRVQHSRVTDRSIRAVKNRYGAIDLCRRSLLIEGGSVAVTTNPAAVIR